MSRHLSSAWLLMLVFAVGVPLHAAAQDPPSACPSGFDKTEIQGLERRANTLTNNPKLFYTIATLYWDAAFRADVLCLSETQQRQFIIKGLQAINRALTLKPPYIEAMVYKNLLLRLQATLENDAQRKAALIRGADELMDKVRALQALNPQEH